MPLVWAPERNAFVLRCINHPQNLALIAGYQTLVGATPPQLIASASGPPMVVPAHIDQNRITPLRCYVCQLCGYIEMYSAPIMDPGEWPGG